MQHDPFAGAPAPHNFGSTEDVAAPAASNVPIMQWLHECGAWEYDAARPGGKGQKVLTRGWHVEVGKWPAFDAVCEKADISLEVVYHSSSKNTAIHWAFESATFFILAKRLYSLEEMGATLTKREGIAYHWPRGGARQMSFFAIIGELLPGYHALDQAPEPIMISVKRMVVQSLQKALEAQMRVIRVNNMWLESTHKKSDASTPCPKTRYSDFSLTIGPGEQETVENKQTNQSSEITTILADVPTLDPFADVESCKDYLNSHATPEDVLALILDQREQVIAWSKEQSAAWAAEATQESGAAHEPGDRPEDYVEEPAPVTRRAPEQVARASAPARQGEPPRAAPAREFKAVSATPTGTAPKAQQFAAPAPRADRPHVEPAQEYARLEDVPGTALPAQRRILASRFGQTEAAWRPGLSRENAAKLIIDAQK